MADFAQALLTVGGDLCFIAFLREVVVEHLGQRGVVLDNQDASFRHAGVPVRACRRAEVTGQFAADRPRGLRASIAASELLVGDGLLVRG